MEALVMVLIIVIALVMLDATSITWGADSRDTLPDDHRR